MLKSAFHINHSIETTINVDQVNAAADVETIYASNEGDTAGERIESSEVEVVSGPLRIIDAKVDNNK